MANFPLQTSYWFQDNAIQFGQKLNSPLQTDVAIVGGGFAGLSAAYHLKKAAPHLNVTLLESNHLGFGASGRNGGWLVPFPPLYWLIEDLKNQEMNSNFQFAIQQNFKFIKQLGKLLGPELSYEDWRPTAHYLAARNSFELAILKWFKARLDLVGVTTEYIETPDSRQLLGYRTKAVLSWSMTAIQPYNFLQKLTQECKNLGVQIFEKSPVNAIHSQPEQFELNVTENILVKAKKVILATNAYSSKVNLDVTLPKGSIQHTYMLATEPLCDEMLQKISRGLHPFGDPSLFYFCGRFHDRRLLFNGGDRTSLALPEDDQHIPSYLKVERELKKRFSFLENVRFESAWGGPVLQTTSDAPVIAPAIENSNFIFNIGFGGSSGICWALQSGRMTTELILGEKSQDKDAEKLRKILQSSRLPILGPARAITGVLQKMAS